MGVGPVNPQEVTSHHPVPACTHTDSHRQTHTSSWYFLSSSATSLWAFSHSSFSLVCSRWYFSCYQGNRQMTYSPVHQPDQTTRTNSWMDWQKNMTQYEYIRPQSFKRLLSSSPISLSKKRKKKKDCISFNTLLSISAHF